MTLLRRILSLRPFILRQPAETGQPERGQAIGIGLCWKR